MRLSINLMLNTSELRCVCLVLRSLWSTSWVCPTWSMFRLCLFLFSPRQRCCSEQRGWGRGYVPWQLVSLLQVLMYFVSLGSGYVFRSHECGYHNPLWLLIFSKSASWRHGIKQETWNQVESRLWAPVWERLKAGRLGTCFLLQTMCTSALSRQGAGWALSCLYPLLSPFPQHESLAGPKTEKNPICVVLIRVNDVSAALGKARQVSWRGCIWKNCPFEKFEKFAVV